MNARRSFRCPLFGLLAAILLLCACQPIAAATSSQPTQPPTATPVIQDTQTPTQATSGEPTDIILDYSAVAENVTAENVAAQPEGTGRPYWKLPVQYRRLTLKGYPITNHQLEPQIFIYSAGELASANEFFGRIVTDLQALLETQQPGEDLPFLPLINTRQRLHAQVEYLNFKNGKGVRFLTQFNQGPVPINSTDLIYTFQGLSSDGKTYIAAVLPITNPELPAGSEVDDQLLNDYPYYLSTTVNLLNQQPAESFTPDMNNLDALIRSIEVK